MEITNFLHKARDSKEFFSVVDLKMMISNCQKYLNALASNPIFLCEELRELLALRNLNFREIDKHIRLISEQEKIETIRVKDSMLKVDDYNVKKPTDAVKGVKHKFVFKGVDRTLSGQKPKYTLFCSLGESKWYFERELATLVTFIKGLKNEDKTKKDAWLQ